MRHYLAISQGMFQSHSTYRFNFIFSVIGNLLYITIMFFLWRSIYQGNDIIRGLTFNQTFLYLALSNSLFILFKTFVEWDMSWKIIDGSILIDLTKPIDYQLQQLFRALGSTGFNLTVITIPSLIALIFFFQVDIQYGLNVLGFILACVFAFLLSFLIDYSVGLTSFYTESLWGISMAKEVLVLFLAGALIPLDFFPAQAKMILEFLPFQSIYYGPITILISPNMQLSTMVQIISVQLFWVAVLLILSRLFFFQASKVLTINGG